jgi:hypothetical protein
VLRGGVTATRRAAGPSGSRSGGGQAGGEFAGRSADAGGA